MNKVSMTITQKTTKAELPERSTCVHEGKDKACTGEFCSYSEEIGAYLMGAGRRELIRSK
jgi:hypothetical protein